MATAEKLVSKFTSDFSTSNTVILLVGPDQYSMTVHGSHFACNSRFFSAALKKAWTEGRTRTIKLPEEQFETMQHYVSYVYTGKFPTSSITSQDSVPKKVAGYELLAVLYVLGERMLDSVLRNAVVREMLRIRISEAFLFSAAKFDEWNPTTKPANIIYEGTTAGSPARRLFVDLHVRFGGKDWDTSDASQEFLCDLTQALFINIQSYKSEMSKWREVALKADGYLV